MSAEAGVCTSCGACCATYRVTFLRQELDTAPGGWVPAALTETINDRGVCMSGTMNRPRRCLALRGTIGVDVGCTIYQRRPSPCRAFAPEAGTGHGDTACGDARRLHGLPPLTGSYDGFPIA
jgi:Fe-S-cluster containining protein